MDSMDLVCLSHLRWDFVYQRPQHLLSRFARTRRVYFIEEPVVAETGEANENRLDISPRDEGVHVVVPRLRAGLDAAETTSTLRSLVDGLFADRSIESYLLWYYTPMALEFTRHLNPAGVVFDCMDELSAFLHAPPRLRELEDELLRRADVVFTGGQSLYEAKKGRHPNIHPFPSSIDTAHFGRARTIRVDPPDQESIPFPRLGYFGVIDERMDLELIEGIADLRPDWHLVLIGPVVKIDPATLPRRENIHYLGSRKYADLPAYLAGWNAALLPFADNESTRFISPTKTPEYLAAGKPVVSTPIRDVARPYGEEGLVRIAATTGEFVNAIEELLETGRDERGRWLARVDSFLRGNSWDATWSRMLELLPDRRATHL